MPYSPVGAFTQVNSATPTGQASGTLVALGLGATLVCGTTGRVLILVTGNVATDTTAKGAQFRIYTGTSATPSNNAAVSGTALGSLQSITSFVTTELNTSFAISAVVTGLTTAPYLGTGAAPVAASTNWFDIMFAQVGAGGTVTFTNVNLIAYEF